MRVQRVLTAFLLASTLAQLPVHADPLFDVKPVTKDVYAAIARPTFRTNCNAVIVLLDDGVLLVDTESKPSAAQELIAYIKKLTDKPVRYVVITHFHADHTQGAETYLKAWPQAEIIASEATRASIPLRGQARMKFEAFNVPGQVENFKLDLGKANSPADKQTIETRLTEANTYAQELRSMRIALPTITISKALRIEQRTHPVEILNLGRAHTDGDLFVFLPRDKILISGDALHSLTPTMRDCYPVEWIQTLHAAERLDFETVVGGHGDVFHGKSTLTLWEDYFSDLLQRASQAYASGATLDETKKQLVPALITTYGNRFPKRFSETVVSNVEKAYRYAGGSTD